MPPDDLFMRATPAMQEATGGPAWVAAMLAAEEALAAAEEEAGMLPAGAAARVRSAVASTVVEPAALRDVARLAGTPVAPLLAAIRANAGDAGQFVHHGATTQDIVDTALALIARRAGAVLTDALQPVARALADLTTAHHDTPMVGRTLLQPALPITFGFKAAGWLLGLVDAASGVTAAIDAIPAQLGGPVGTLGEFGDSGLAVATSYAARLALPAPEVPWHNRRHPVARLGAALGILAGSVAKVATDVVLLAQAEVAEVTESRGPGRGVSSAMAGKHNPAASIAAIAATRQAVPLAQALVVALDHEHERAAGAWQAEAPLLCDLFGHVSVAVDSLGHALIGAEVDGAAMREHLSLAAPSDAEPARSSAPVFIERALATYARSPLAGDRS